MTSMVRSATLLLVLLTGLVGCTPLTPVPTSTPFGNAVPSRQPTPTLGDVPAVIGQPFDISIGASVLITGADLRVTLVGVENDSRCPVDVTCVRAGDATARLLVQVGRGEIAPASLIVGHEDPAKSRATIGSYTLTALDLAPAPRSTRPITQGDYVLRLVVRLA